MVVRDGVVTLLKKIVLLGLESADGVPLKEACLEGSAAPPPESSR